jgi:hypothetical protein
LTSFTVTVIAVIIADGIPHVNHPPELDAVLNHLRHQYDAPSLTLDGAPARLNGGFWAEMWTLTLTAHNTLPTRLVLRLAPDRQLAAWETTLQASVANQGYPTPVIRASDFAPADDGRAWCVMDHAEGTPLLGGLSGPRALLALPRLATALPDTLARAAANLHRLDPEPIEAALARLTDRTIGIDAVLDHYRSRAFDLADAPLLRAVNRLAMPRRPSPLQRARRQWPDCGS